VDVWRIALTRQDGTLGNQLLFSRLSVAMKCRMVERKKQLLHYFNLLV
jgi:hypothetical protein